MSKWSEFYKDRMNRRYFQHFQQKYGPFLRLIENNIKKHDFLMELGCGIANTTKYLMSRGSPAFSFAISDRDLSMLALAKEWCPRAKQYAGDITASCICPRYKDNGKEIGHWNIFHSHGVLEHLPDWKIQRAIDQERLDGARIAIHYVPSAKYEKPSFGDERLMTPNQWYSICKPTEIMEFNNGYDLALIWRF